jgi:hypothetical protein
MINYVVYSHTDYLDILNIQTDYLKYCSNKILLINKSDLNLDIYTEYKKVIFYDDSLPYASRILSLSKLDDEYILLIHDIDILINVDNDIIEHLLGIMMNNNIDRVDLKRDGLTDTENIDVNFKGEYFTLTKQENVYNYIYNVNPSIWKISSLLETMNKFSSQNYRTIENKPTQDFCTKYNVYKLYNDVYVDCGYFSCLHFFKFLHITHGGGLLPINNNRLESSLNFEYQTIIQKYLSGGNRPFKNTMW